MDISKTDLFIISNKDKFPEAYLISIKQRLEDCDDSKLSSIFILEFKDPILALILSFLVGGIGIDRFYIGDNTLGLLKLLTCGGFGICAIIDLFLIMGATKKKNFDKLMSFL